MILMSWPAVSWLSRYDTADQQHREENEVVEHLVANRFPEDADRDRADDAHGYDAARGSWRPRDAMPAVRRLS